MSNREDSNVMLIMKSIVIKRGRGGCCALSERKQRLVESHVARDEHTVARQVKAAIAFVFSRVAEKDTKREPRCQFVRGSGG